MKNLLLRWLAAFAAGFLLFLLFGFGYSLNTDHHYTVLQCIAVMEALWIALAGGITTVLLAMRLAVYAIDGE